MSTMEDDLFTREPEELYRVPPPVTPGERAKANIANILAQLRERHEAARVTRPRWDVIERHPSATSCAVRMAPGCSGRAEQLHHRKRRSQGGRNDYSNLLACCSRCHAWVHDHPAASYEQGWLVHSWEDPKEVPVCPG